MKAFYKDYNMPTDRRVAKRMFRIVGENCKELPSVFAEVIGKRFGGDTDAYVDYLYDNSVFADRAEGAGCGRSPERTFRYDPAVLLEQIAIRRKCGNWRRRSWPGSGNSPTDSGSTLRG